MGILVQNLAKRGCITIKEDSHINELIELLNLNKIGCVAVVKKNNSIIVGIISERDIIRNYEKISKNKNIIVSEIMTHRVLSCTTKTSSKDIMEMMTKNRIRHIPIIENKKLLGIVSIGDVVNRIIENYATEAKYLREYIYN